MNDRLRQQQQTASLLQAQLDDKNALVALMTDQKVTEYTMAGANLAVSAVARFYADAQSHVGGLIVWNLPPSPPGTVYQVWLIDASGAYSSAGAFRVGSNGSSELLVRAQQTLGSYRSLVVSIEPGRGNRQPKGRHVLSVSF